jgi:hypothetical protein
MKLRLLALAVVLAAAVTTNEARAQYCDNYGYGYGYLYDSLGYNVPYYAAFPPVYYSYPVPRTYGYSPFAYPPGTMTPEVAPEPEPVTIVNPYVPKSDVEPQEDRAVEARRQPQPLVVLNPYVAPMRTVAHSEN